MFGMGTGGSLRLLSPETYLSLDSIAVAFLLPSIQPSNGLPTSSLQLRNCLRSLSLALSAPSKPHRLEIPLPLTKTRVISLRNFFCRTLSSVSLHKPLAFLDQALDLLVSSSSIRYRTFTDDLSTSSSLRGLTSLRCGNSFLQGGFTLRCLQRLSRPHFASQLCHWHDNCCTRGASIPVLSY